MIMKQIPLDLCKELFYYNDDGILFWKKLHSKQCKNFKIGDVVGYVNELGYVVAEIKGVQTRVHRILYQMYNNFQLTDEYIDHIDGNPSNNRKDNLRICTHSENQCNRGHAQKNNKSTGLKNIRVYTNSNDAKYWEINITKNKVTHRVKYKFELFVLEDIIKIRDKLLEELHKEFKNLG